MVAPRALVFRPLAKRNEDSGNEIVAERKKKAKPKFQLGRFLRKAQVIISRQLEAIVFIILQIFCYLGGFEDWDIPQF